MMTIDPEQDLLDKILGVMYKRPGMLLGVNKGFKYKGFSDGKYVKLKYSHMDVPQEAALDRVKPNPVNSQIKSVSDNQPI